jgi:hypothetical protein
MDVSQDILQPPTPNFHGFIHADEELGSRETVVIEPMSEEDVKQQVSVCSYMME